MNMFDNQERHSIFLCHSKGGIRGFGEESFKKSYKRVYEERED